MTNRLKSSNMNQTTTHHIQIALGVGVIQLTTTQPNVHRTSRPSWNRNNRCLPGKEDSSKGSQVNSRATCRDPSSLVVNGSKELSPKPNSSKPAQQSGQLSLGPTTRLDSETASNNLTVPAKLELIAAVIDSPTLAPRNIANNCGPNSNPTPTHPIQRNLTTKDLLSILTSKIEQQSENMNKHTADIKTNINKAKHNLVKDTGRLKKMHE